MIRLVKPGWSVLWGALWMGCSSAGSDAPSTPTAAPEFQIVTPSGGALEAFAGDALKLRVVRSSVDGSTGEVTEGSVVTWTEPFLARALSPGSHAPDPLPPASDQPTGVWLENPGRPDVDGTGLLFVLDPGTVQNAMLTVSASISGTTPAQITATIAISPAPSGRWVTGATTYAAQCAACHGPTGHGTPPDPDGVTYTMNNVTYAYPAPGINAEPGNVASDPAWNAALFAFAARADVDQGGTTLRLPMPDWASANLDAGQALTAQDFADIYAFLKTQTH